MESSSSFRTRYVREFDRLGLDEALCPKDGMISGSDAGAERFLDHLRSLDRGATWRDVFPDLPAHWDLDDPESWTYPYRPMFSFDYQALPTGPVCMASFALGTSDDKLTHLLADAAAEGFLIHGAGYMPVENPAWPDRPVRIVLHHSTTQARMYEFGDWVEARPDVSLDGFSRGVNERWAPEPRP